MDYYEWAVKSREARSAKQLSELEKAKSKQINELFLERKETGFEEYSDSPPQMRAPKSRRWDSYKVIERGFGQPPSRISVRPMLVGEFVDYDPRCDEWCWYIAPGNTDVPNSQDKEKIEALQTTVNLLKNENAMLHNIVERLAQRMDRLEFNAELGDDDYDEREREELTAPGSDGESGTRSEGESIPASA